MLRPGEHGSPFGGNPPGLCWGENLISLGILCEETHDRIMRFAPPLVIKREEIDWALVEIEKALRS